MKEAECERNNLRRIKRRTSSRSRRKMSVIGCKFRSGRFISGAIGGVAPTALWSGGTCATGVAMSSLG